MRRGSTGKPPRPMSHTLQSLDGLAPKSTASYPEMQYAYSSVAEELAGPLHRDQRTCAFSLLLHLKIRPQRYLLKHLLLLQLPLCQRHAAHSRNLGCGWQQILTSPTSKALPMKGSDPLLTKEPAMSWAAMQVYVRTPVGTLENKRSLFAELATTQQLQLKRHQRACWVSWIPCCPPCLLSHDRPLGCDL